MQLCDLNINLTRVEETLCLGRKDSVTEKVMKRLPHVVLLKDSINNIMVHLTKLFHKHLNHTGLHFLHLHRDRNPQGHFQLKLEGVLSNTHHGFDNMSDCFYKIPQSKLTLLKKRLGQNVSKLSKCDLKVTQFGFQVVSLGLEHLLQLA
jgi:hypothetical protein